MDFFTGIREHLSVLEGVLGEVDAERLTAVTARLGDDEVVAVIETFLSEAVSHLLAGTGRG